METTKQTRSTAQLAVRLSNDGSVCDNNEAALLMFNYLRPKYPSKKYQLGWEKTYCCIIKPRRPNDRPFGGLVLLAASPPLVMHPPLNSEPAEGLVDGGKALPAAAWCVQQCCSKDQRTTESCLKRLNGYD